MVLVGSGIAMRGRRGGMAFIRAKYSLAGRALKDWIRHVSVGLMAVRRLAEGEFRAR